MLNVKAQMLFSEHHQLPPNNYNKKKLKCEEQMFFLNSISYTKIKVKQTKVISDQHQLSRQNGQF